MMDRYSFGVSVFPGDGQQTKDELYDYIRAAAECGCDEVFSSLHVPELDATETLRELVEIAQFAHDHHMQFSVDISGKAALALMEDSNNLSMMRRMQFDWVRMDFGFEIPEMLNLVERVSPRGLMLNASVLNPQQLAQQVAMLKAACPQLQLRGHHNYYPMPETGISLEFMARRSAQYLPYGIPVTACVAAHNKPRFPLKKGLPTVEQHRNLPSGIATKELLDTGVVDAVLIGDPFASKQDLMDVALMCGRIAPVLHLRCSSGSTPQELAFVFERKHRARPDEAAFAVRSQTSREMAALGELVKPRLTTERKRGDVLVINENALRYSGEVQVMKCDKPPEGWYNHVGTVVPEDMWKLDLLRAGCDFWLAREDE